MNNIELPPQVCIFKLPVYSLACVIDQNFYKDILCFYLVVQFESILWIKKIFGYQYNIHVISFFDLIRDTYQVILVTCHNDKIVSICSKEFYELIANPTCSTSDECIILFSFHDRKVFSFLLTHSNLMPEPNTIFFIFNCPNATCDLTTRK